MLCNGISVEKEIVLVWAGMEWIYFLGADTVLWFGFRMLIILITQGCWSWVGLTLTEDFWMSHALQWGGGAQEARREHRQDSDLNWPRGYSKPEDVRLRIEAGIRVGWEGLIAAQGGIGISQWVVNSWIEHHLVFMKFIPLSIFITSFSLKLLRLLR